nr:MAG TPA: hypothetical protein [Caudoviricetes sp.]
MRALSHIPEAVTHAETAVRIVRMWPGPLPFSPPAAARLTSWTCVC